MRQEDIRITSSQAGATAKGDEHGKPHKKLEVWKCAMRLAQLVYAMAGQFPAKEKFGLVSQMGRAAVGIPCNIAEGVARKGKKEVKNFLSMAQESLSELHTQMDLSVCLGFTTRNDVATISRELVKIDKMLTGVIRSLGKTSSRDTGAL